MQRLIPGRSTGLYNVVALQASKDYYGQPRDCEYTLATGLDRRDAAQMAGLALLSPQYHTVRLIEERTPDRWEDVPEGTP